MAFSVFYGLNTRRINNFKTCVLCCDSRMHLWLAMATDRKLDDRGHKRQSPVAKLRTSPHH